jgi:hypothetical protein
MINPWFKLIYDCCLVCFEAQRSIALRLMGFGGERAVRQAETRQAQSATASVQPQMHSVEVLTEGYKLQESGITTDTKRVRAHKRRKYGRSRGADGLVTIRGNQRDKGRSKGAAAQAKSAVKKLTGKVKGQGRAVGRSGRGKGTERAG